MTGGAVAAALGAAGLFGLASALQHQEARAVDGSSRPSLLVTLARRPIWLLGLLADVAAVGLQGLALGLGSVTLVQTLLVAGLPLAALLSALLAHRHLVRLELIGLGLCSAGLALLGPALAAAPVGHPPSRADALIAASCVVLVAIPLLAVRQHPRFGGAAAGLAAGVVIGAGSVLLAVTVSRVGHWEDLFESFALYGAVIVGVAGLLLAQVAFQTGDIGAPLAALSIGEPIVAVILAVTVLGEQLPTSSTPRLAALTGAALAVVGVLALSHAGHQLKEPR